MQASAPGTGDDTDAGRVGILLTELADGGVERMSVQLARGMAALGYRVDFFVSRAEGPFLEQLKAPCEIVSLGAADDHALVAALSGKLSQRRPAALLCAKMRDDAIAMAARERAGSATRVFVWPSTNFSARINSRPLHVLQRRRTRRHLAHYYPRADGIIAVSEGVAADITALTGVPRDGMHVVPYPVVTPELDTLAAESPDHSFFAENEPAVLLGIGGFRRQKDFGTLIRAFARLRSERACRLMILGEGRKRGKLERLARRLGVEADVALPGFAANPYAYLRRSAVFVLSSLWEGSPNVLTEALAVGTPAVATDCPSGPRELLRGGELGPLVPTGRPPRLAEAVAATLDAPPDRERLRAAAAPFEMTRSARAYLTALGLLPDKRREALSPRA